MKALKIFLAIVIPGGFLAAIIYGGIGIYKFTKICYKPSGFKIIDVDKDFIRFEISMLVKNPSHLAIEIGGYSFNISINDSQVATIINKDKKILKSQEVSTLVIPVKVDYNKVFNSVKSKEIILNFISRRLDKIFISLSGKFIGNILTIPIFANVNMKHSVTEILNIAKEPSMPCDIN